jgi:hypothetical protein
MLSASEFWVLRIHSTNVYVRWAERSVVPERAAYASGCPHCSLRGARDVRLVSGVAPQLFSCICWATSIKKTHDPEILIWALFSIATCQLLFRCAAAARRADSRQVAGRSGVPCAHQQSTANSHVLT